MTSLIFIGMTDIQEDNFAFSDRLGIQLFLKAFRPISHERPEDLFSWYDLSGVSRKGNNFVAEIKTNNSNLINYKDSFISLKDYNDLINHTKGTDIIPLYVSFTTTHTLIFDLSKVEADPSCHSTGQLLQYRTTCGEKDQRYEDVVWLIRENCVRNGSLKIQNKGTNEFNFPLDDYLLDVRKRTKITEMIEKYGFIFN